MSDLTVSLLPIAAVIVSAVILMAVIAYFTRNQKTSDPGDDDLDALARIVMADSGPTDPKAQLREQQDQELLRLIREMRDEIEAGYPLTVVAPHLDHPVPMWCDDVITCSRHDVKTCALYRRCCSTCPTREDNQP